MLFPVIFSGSFPIEVELMSTVAKNLGRSLKIWPPSAISFVDKQGNFDPASIEGMVSALQNHYWETMSRHRMSYVPFPYR